MTTIHKLEGAVILGLIFLACCIGVQTLRYHQRMLVAEAVAEQRQKAIDARSADIRTRDAADKAYAQPLAQESASLQTPQQAARVIVRYLPQAAPAGTPAAAALAVAPVTVAPEQLSPELRKELPDSPSYTLFTQPQTLQIARDELACDATRHSLATCVADRMDLQASLSDETRIAENWKTTAKGGSRWQRIGRVAKLAGCAAAGAGTAALIKSTPQSAAIGGSGAVILCSTL